MRNVSLVLLCTLVAGCALPNQAFRTVPASEPAVVAAGACPSVPASLEVTPEYALGVVEFDDQGWYWDRASADAILGYMDRVNTTSRVTVVLYVHGWKHNAKVDDENINCFRQTLRYVVRQQSADTKVVGIYVGWRGALIETPLLKEFTFWNRKATAGRIGTGDIVAFLAHLGRLRESSNRFVAGRNTVIAIGHSFGAALLYSTLSPQITGQLVRQQALPSNVPSSTFADLVVLVNPAFEASIFNTLHNVGKESTGPPVLVFVSSEGDRATQKAFPIGRRFSAAFQSFRSDEQRQQAITTVGNYEPFIDAHLKEICGTRERVTEVSTETGSCACPWTLGDRTAPLQPTENEYRWPGMLCVGNFELEEGLLFKSVLNIRVPNAVVEGHNGIFRSEFVHLLTDLISLISESRRVMLTSAATDIRTASFPEERFDLLRKRTDFAGTTVESRMAIAKPERYPGIFHPLNEVTRCAVRLDITRGPLTLSRFRNYEASQGKGLGVYQPVVPGVPADTALFVFGDETFVITRSSGAIARLSGSSLFVDSAHALLFDVPEFTISGDLTDIHGVPAFTAYDLAHGRVAFDAPFDAERAVDWYRLGDRLFYLPYDRSSMYFVNVSDGSVSKVPFDQATVDRAAPVQFVFKSREQPSCIPEGIPWHRADEAWCFANVRCEHVDNRISLP
jgi:hypothetical protein